MVNQTPLRILFGLPLVLFVPGYVLIAALFPRNDDLDWLERAALSLGLSIAVVPLLGLVLNYTPWGIRLAQVSTAISLFVVAKAAAAAYRHLSSRRGQPRGPHPGVRRRRSGNHGPTATARPLSFSLVTVAATTAFVIFVPKEGEHFSEFYLLGANGKAADYPTAFGPGTPQWVTVGVSNYEYRDVGYTVETHAFNQTFDPATNTSSIDRTVLLDSYRVTLPHNLFQHRVMIDGTQIHDLTGLHARLQDRNFEGTRYRSQSLRGSLNLFGKKSNGLKEMSVLHEYPLPREL